MGLGHANGQHGRQILGHRQGLFGEATERFHHVFELSPFLCIAEAVDKNSLDALQNIRERPHMFGRSVLAHPLGEKDGLVLVHFAVGQDAGARQLVHGLGCVAGALE